MMYRMRISVILGVVCLLAAVWWAGCGSGAPQSTQATPQVTDIPVTLTIDGAAMLNTYCSRCHSIDRVTGARKTRERWEQTVTRMIDKGSQMTDAEKAALVDYLAATYGR